ncbi:hypothetical protein HHL21_12860 [Massilia sp. RP-1-19]|uniref:N-acetyltransferase domain-containing protein n=1 Tax=Massilia polaris TaxID=2728846 RepID=A0A848HQ87_9BURK|nr:hypothetical protein [Massilia polaris]NML61951.1 hypothetical protein [Massilia polaris]
MTLSEIANEVSRLISAGAQLHRMPRAHLQFHLRLHREHIQATHRIFTQPHPRYRLIKNKTVGIALIDLRRFKTAEDYLDTVKKKDFAAYHAHKAKIRGYRVHHIDRNFFIDDIYDIHTSAETRQGRPMDDAYRIKETSFQNYPHFGYFGILDKREKLVGYCTMATLGNFAATERVIGHKNGDGFMYLLLTEIICSLIEEKTVSFLMYDTYLGAQPGLRNFKRKLGFSPYLVRYSVA